MSERMRPVKRRSHVWKFFKISDKTVVCNMCKKHFKLSPNTSNLLEHLRRKHPGYLIEAISGAHSEPRPVVRASMLAPPCYIPPGIVIRTVEVPPVEPAVPKREIIPTTDKPSDLSEFERNDIDNSVIKIVTKDLLPLSIVDGEGFLEYSQELQPLYQVPKRERLSNTMLSNKYTDMSNKLKIVLQNVAHVTITTDMWIFGSSRSFLTVTCHFIVDGKKHSAVLATREVPANHTVENVSTVLANVFDEWSISTKVVTIVSDNGWTIKKATNEILKKYHHPCVAHTLNACVIDALNMNPEVVNLLIKCRTIISHSSLATEQFKSMQGQIVQLKQDIPPMWTSSLEMLERILLVKEPLTEVFTRLADATMFLTASEWEIISDCIAILKPIETMTIELSAEKYPSMSLVIPLVRGLQLTIKNQKLKSAKGNLFKNAILDFIQWRLGILEADKICAKATFLDPRLKKIAFGNSANAANAEKFITEELTFLIIKKRGSTTAVNQDMALHGIDDSKETISLWTTLDKKISEAKTTYRKAPSVVAGLAVKQYLQADYLDRSQDPLTFWKTHKAISPELFMLSQKYLCISATSVPPERVFTEAGDTMNDRRKSLQTEKLDKILFLNSNYDW